MSELDEARAEIKRLNGIINRSFSALGAMMGQRDRLKREFRSLGNALTKEYSNRDKWAAARGHLKQMGEKALDTLADIEKDATQ